MILYEHSDYRKLIKLYVAEQNSLKNKLTYQSLAEVLRIQKSYLSKMMNGDANLNKDQAYLLANFMQLSEEETDYLYLLIDYDRAGIDEHKLALQKKIKKLQLKNTQSNKYLDKEAPKLSSSQMQEYYLLPEVQLVHLACGLSKYKYSPDLIKQELKVSDQIFKQSLNILEKLELIKITPGEIQILKSNLHLDNSSPFFHQWHAQFKLKSLEWIKQLETEDKYNFLASFSASDEDKEKIRLEFLNFLKKVEKIVKNSDSENLYQLNFDLFKWT